MSRRVAREISPFRFRGQSAESMTPVGRTMFPSFWRRALGPRRCITLSLTSRGCGVVTEVGTPADPEDRIVRSWQVPISLRGKLRIPQKLRAALGARAEVVWVGLIDNAELWAVEAWSRMYQEVLGTARADVAAIVEPAIESEPLRVIPDEVAARHFPHPWPTRRAGSRRCTRLQEGDSLPALNRPEDVAREPRRSAATNRS
jgi:hypothetical protein